METNLLTPEQEVLETLERIAPLGISFCAVYVGMSKLSAENRGYRQLEIVSKLFEPLLNNPHSRLFLLSNHDFLLLTAHPVLEVIDNIFYQIRNLFADDVLMPADSTNSFEQIFFLDKEMEKFKSLLKQRTPQAQTKIQESTHSGMLESLTPEKLEHILFALEQTNTLDFIKRQDIVKIAQNSKNQTLYQEFFTSVFELQKVLAPTTDLLSDKSLFYQLTQTLDKRMLGALTHIHLTHWAPAIGLNLNLSSLFTPIFEKTLQSLETSLIVEFQLADILQHISLYEKALSLLHQKGQQLAIDNIEAGHLNFLDLSLLHADYIKIFWSPALMEMEKEIKRHISQNPNTIFILAHAGEKQAIVWGKQVGFTFFQGYFTDAVLAAVSKSTCTFGQECTLLNCLQSRGSVYGVLRERCVHTQHLDASMEIKVD